MSENIRAVPIGEIVVSNAPEDILVAYGLGSCVAICLHDPVAQVGGMLHALLPAPADAHLKDGSNPAKFVDRGTPLLIKEMLKLGAKQTRMVAKLCGGAQVLYAPDLEDNTLNIGKRNVQAAERALHTVRLRIRARDTGGNVGRTVRLYIADGKITVRSLGKGEQVLI
ncbi:MAG: chemotaxis protein CheD [Chloroflexota bacterium]|nr:chemotaxis protein CheD [Chloroflexota bacterium]